MNQERTQVFVMEMVGPYNVLTAKQLKNIFNANINEYVINNKNKQLLLNYDCPVLFWECLIFVITHLFELTEANIEFYRL